jgi:ribosome maturation factor RimP
MSTSARLQELIEPIVKGLGLDLFDLEYSGSTLSVLVDRPRPAGSQAAERSGVDVEAITRVSRAVSRALDEADPIPGHYSLEVSSPGLERPLRTPAHFAGALGEVITVKTTPAHEGRRRLKGQLVRAPGEAEADPSIDVEVDGTVHTVPLAEIERVRTVFEWGGEPKPAGPKRQKGPKGQAKNAQGQKGQALRRPKDTAARADAGAGGTPTPPVSPGPAVPGDEAGPSSDPPPPGAEHGGSATLHEPDAMINGDDQKVSAS